jgi:phage terminase large subunit
LGELEDIGYGGARGGGKTHCGFAQIAIDDCQKWPITYQFFFFARKPALLKSRCKSSVHGYLPRVPHRPTRSIIYFPNGSSIKIGHFQYEKDINQYLSLEYDVIFIEQAEQLSQSKIEEIKTVNRTSIPNFKPRTYYTFNPGGISHTFLKTNSLNLTGPMPRRLPGLSLRTSTIIKRSISFIARSSRLYPDGKRKRG